MIMLADQSGDLLSAGAGQPSWVQIQARHSGETRHPVSTSPLLGQLRTS